MPAPSERHKHELYQESVQNPPFEVSLLQRFYRGIRGKSPRRLREDFCGTALLSCEWARRVRGGEAVGIDLDEPTLRWGRRHNLEPLGRRADRVRLERADVLEYRGDAPDLVVAFNFSWFVFRTRSVLLEYFRRVHAALAEGGIFVLDIYGGSEAQEIREESTRQRGFRYVWEQARYNPITGDYLCHIHFDFPDGSRRERAFTYHWRLWGLPETLDLLREAGFERPRVWWEGTDPATGGGNGVFRPSTRGDDSVSWIAYIVAPK